MEITHIKDLTPDVQNARTHPARNLSMIEKSLNEVGAARSIVIDEDGTILAGNGLIAAAAAAGIEKVQVIPADGETIIAVQRTGLTERQKRRLALYDNRTAELAEWDTTVLSDMLEEDEKAFTGMFNKDELDALLGGIEEDDNYTRTIELPLYKPTGEKPALADLVNTERTDSLLAEIDAADIPENEKHFLRIAAQRHTVFYYNRIAEYYAQSAPALQRLMENSALVIIDFNRAVELGFVKLTDAVLQQYQQDYGNDE